MHPVKPCFSPPVRLKKEANGRDVSAKNAFSREELITFSVVLPRTLGITGVAVLLVEDEKGERMLPLHFVKSEKGWDTYRLALSLLEITPETGGLFFYSLRFSRGAEALWSDSPDNATFSLAEERGRPFSLLAYRADLSVPRRFCGRVMYHIFVDRFAPGGDAVRRADAVYHSTWDEELCQLAAYPGAPVANTELYGGTLWGILDRLDYLCSLGVGILYLSPIFRAHSNHKYDTGDYEEVALEFGGEAALRALIAACKRRDILLILDGVFNHTGDDSKYFDRYGRYGGGAFENEASPYRTWYHFDDSALGYAAWWGIPILPKLALENAEVRRYFLGEEGIVARYLEMGVDGWRLDVADELPNAFLEQLHALVKEKTGGNGVILGEVWENAATKIAYGQRRRYFLGRQLDSVMNYPLRQGILSFVRDTDAPTLCRVLRELWSSYPTPVCHALMNLLSSHDTARILTALGGEEEGGRAPLQLRDVRMSETDRRRAVQLLRIAATLQYTVFGVPSLYYGDEALMEGYGDPLCRRPYPWGREDRSLLTFYKKLGKIRREHTVFGDGEFELLAEGAHALAFSRRNAREWVIVAANRGKEDFPLCLPRAASELLFGRHAAGEVQIAPDTVTVWRIDDV